MMRSPKPGERMAAIRRDLAHDGYYCRSDAEYLLSEIDALTYRLHGAEALLQRVQNYLSHGGLFNPELMESAAVRKLILDLAGLLGDPAQEPSAPKDVLESLHRVFTNNGIASYTDYPHLAGDVIRWACEMYRQSKMPPRVGDPEGPQPEQREESTAVADSLAIAEQEPEE